MKASTRRNLVIAGIAGGVAVLLVWALIPDPIPVDVAAVERGAMQVTIDEDGQVRAHDRFVVTAPVAGRVARIDLHEGDQVSEGQTLATLWPLPLSAREREEQTARIAAAEAAVREAQDRARRADADFAQARRERARLEALVKENYISPQAVEKARLAETAAASEVQAAQHRVQMAKADLQAARATMIAVSDSKGGASILIRSPASGRVLSIPERSERVVTAGSMLLSIGDPEKLEVVVDVLSADAVRINAGMPMLLEGWGGPTLRARVRTVEPHAFTKVSALGVEEQRVNVVADLVDSPGRLGDGYRVEAKVVLWTAEQVLKAPASALFRIGDAWSVFVVQEGKARQREIRIGHRNPREAEVLGGLDEGMQVVRHPSNRIAEGAPVKPIGNSAR